MFSSLSSCTPSTLVTTTFTAKTNQELRINQPVKVVGPNVYNITANINGFEVTTDTTGPSYFNPVINLIRGVTYRFNTTSSDNSVYLTTTGGSEYSTGFRYTNYDNKRQRFIYAGYQNTRSAAYLTWPNVFAFATGISSTNWTVSVVKESGGVFPGTVLQSGVDYVASNPSAGSILFDFTGKTTSIGQRAFVYFFTGAFQLSTTLSGQNYAVKVNGVLQIPNTHYVITHNVLRFIVSKPTGAHITVDYHGGMEGGFFFTPSATTPSTLYYRSRKPGGLLLGTINVTTSGYVYPANTLIKLKQNETASVTVTSPSTYLGYQFYEYFLSGSPLTQNFFAVVNKNNYNPLVKGPDRIKRYYNYLNYAPSFTLYDTTSNTIIYKSVNGLGTGPGLGRIEISGCHVILDVVNYQVNLYSPAGGLLRSVRMPDFPIEFEKYTYYTGAQLTTDLLVLCADGVLYIIDSDLSITSCQQFAPDTRSLGFLDSNLPINEDIPFVGSFSDAARRNLVKSLFPVVTSFAVYGSTVFLVGANSLAKVNLSTQIIFSVQNFPALGGLLNVSPFLWWGVIATSLLHRVYFINSGGNVTDITPSGGPFVFGVHCTMPYTGGGRVCIPDAHNHRLVVYNDVSASSISFINLGDFVPAYAKRFDDIIYVTGHDTNEVIKIEITNLIAPIVTETLNTKITRYAMPYKTTLVSAIRESMLAYHYLNNRFTLEFSGTGIKKVIPPTFEYREGPPSSIGTSPEQVYLLGEPVVTPIPGPYMQWWVNGEIKADLRDGELLGVNYRASAAGTHSSPIILGEHAIDYRTKTFVDASYVDHYNAFAYGVNLMPPGATYVAPVFAPGEYVLPFNLNYFGTVYNSFTFHASGGLTSGILTFDPSFPIASIVPSFANAATDALLVEPRRIYIDYPIDNRNVSAVTWLPLAGGKIPGAYYTQGIIGEFQYYKWKYIGTNELPLPNGFLQTTENINQIGTEINMLSTTGVAINDYVSNPITGTPPYPTIISTGPVVGNPGLQVLGISSYLFNINAYWTEGNVIYSTTSIGVPAKLYSKVTNSAGQLLGYSAAKNYNTFHPGNIIISVDSISNSIIVEGLTNLSLIDKNRYIFEITINKTSTQYLRGLTAPYFTTIVAGPTTTTTVTEIVQANSIVHQNFTFNPLNPRTANTYIQVSKTIYDSLVVNQNLFSSLFTVNPEPLIAKHTIVKSFSIKITPKIAFEGIGLSPPSTIVIDLTTTNVEDGTYLEFQLEPGNLFRKVTVNPPGSDFQGGWEIESPVGTLYYTVPTPTTAPIAFQIYGNAARIKIKPLTDAISAEGTESYKIRFFGIDPSNPSAFVSLPTNYFTDSTSLNNPGIATSSIGSIAVPATLITEYYLEVANPYTTSTSDIIQVQTTKISFATLPAAVRLGTLVGSVNYALPQPPPPAPAVTDPTDTLVVDVYTHNNLTYKIYNLELLDDSLVSLTGSITALQFTGQYLSFSYPQNLPAQTPMLFKPFISHSPVEFELAFYVGRNFQYIEYNYLPPPEHDNTLTIGLRNAAGTYVRSVPGHLAITYSRLFGGEAADGVFYDLNGGSFTHIPTGGFLPRYPRIFKERVFDDNSIRYDVYIDYKIPNTVDLRASLDYGYLRINDGLYDGTTKIKENDILSVIIPFQNSQIVSAVILSIGAAQFALVATPNSAIENKTRNQFILPNQPIITNLNSSFTITATGRYMVPDYFRSASGNGAEYEFVRYLFGTIPAGTLSRGNYHDLTAGDLIVVNNIFTGYRNYNTVEIVFAGVTIESFKVETVGKPSNIINYLNYGVLVEPFKLLKRTANIFVTSSVDLTFDPSNQQKFNQLVGPVLGPNVETFDGESVPEYQALELETISSAAPGTPIDLFASGGKVSFIVNSSRIGANSVVAFTGDKIGLEWELSNYHESNITIWQITQDPTDFSNVYTEVGKWNVVHKQLDPLLINLEQGAGRSVKSVSVISPGAGYNRNNIDVVFSDPPQGGQRAEGFAVLTDPPPSGTGQIIQIILNSGGSGYTVPPTVTVTGPNTSPAVLEAFLVDSVIARETELRIPLNFNKELEQTIVVSALDSEKLEQSYEISANLTTKTDELPTIISAQTFPFKPNLEFNYITTPQPLYSKSEPQSFITSDFIYSKGFPPTLLNSLVTDSKLVPFNYFTSTLTYGPVINFTYLFDKLKNASNVDPAQTVLIGDLPNYDINRPAREFYGRYNEDFLKINLASVKGASGIKEGSRTVFSGNSMSSISHPATDVSVKAALPLIAGASNQLLTLLSGYSKIIQITQLSYEASQSKLLPQTLLDGFLLNSEFNKITYLLGASSTPEVFNYNIITSEARDSQKMTEAILEGNKLNPDSVYINLSFGKNDFENTVITLFTNAMPEPNNIKISELKVTMPDASVAVTNILESLRLNGEYSKMPTILEKTLGSKYYDFTSFNLELISVYSTINTFDAKLYPINLSIESATVLLTSLHYSPEIAGLPLIPEWFYQDKLFLNLDPEFVFQDKLFVDLDPEHVFQDKLFLNLDPEHVFQDKLFVDLEPELIFQDKLFVDLEPELIFQDKLFVDLLPELITNSNRYINFDPELLMSTNRYIHFDSELLDSGSRLIDFNPYFTHPVLELQDFYPDYNESNDRLILLDPMLGDPGNRYIDFDPYNPPETLLPVELNANTIQSDPTLWEMYPEVIYQDKAFIQLTPEVVYQDKLFFQWNPQLFQLNVKYLKDASVYGAFKTEFTIYADDGRAGDLGQYKGSPPGTTGRPRGPFIAYKEFMGSALVMKSPTYGLGGFTTLAAAQVEADKYVDARPFKAVLSDVWNYRIYFDKRVFYPRKSRVFPRIWYIRGG